MKFIFLSMLAIAALSSCSKDNELNGGDENNVPAGEPTYATFKFNVEGSKPNSRSAMEEEVGDEDKINDIRLLIFDGVAPDGLLLTQTTVDHATQSATIATTSGPKRIFVVANSKTNAALNGLTATSKLSNFYDLMTDKSAGTVPAPDTDMGAGFKSMITNASMWMSNVADISSLKTLAPNITEAESSAVGAGDAKNHFTFTVKRSVAKGNLLVKVADTEIKTKDGIFTFGSTVGDITYAVRNVNRSVNFIQQFVGGHGVTSNDEQDAHALNGVRPMAPYYNQFNGMGDAVMKNLATYAPYYFKGYDVVGTDAMKAGIAVNGAAGPRTVNAYFTENSNNLQVRGNTSYFAIATKTTLIDKSKIAQAFNFDAGTGLLSTTAAAANYTTGDFWYIRNIPVAANISFATENDKRYVFVDEDLAFNAIWVVLTRANIIATADFADGAALKAAYNAGTLTFDMHQYFGKYTDGLSYYRLNIYETIDATGTRRHLVRRNHAYLATVTGFNALGEPTEDDLDKDPEKPVDAETTHVTATIKVQPWHEVEMEDEL